MKQGDLTHLISFITDGQISPRTPSRGAVGEEVAPESRARACRTTIYLFAQSEGRLRGAWSKPGSVGRERCTTRGCVDALMASVSSLSGSVRSHFGFSSSLLFSPPRDHRRRERLGEALGIESPLFRRCERNESSLKSHF